MDKLLALMARLRDPEHGCPWDLEQTYRSLLPHTLEETYEVIDAVERGDVAALREELGDLLFQVVFYAEIARGQGAFDFEDVVAGIVDKLVRRHPHVFGGEQKLDAAAQSRRWEEIKAAEKAVAGRADSVLDDIPLALPALTRAVKLSKRAGRIGLDWPDQDGPWAKIHEELQELDEVRRGDNRAAIVHELGDVLLAATNLARHLSVDPEAALRQANRRFERRFRHVEDEARRTGRTDLESLEAFWLAAKRTDEADDPG
jgi:ATP diphosphatase